MSNIFSVLSKFFKFMYANDKFKGKKTALNKMYG